MTGRTVLVVGSGAREHALLWKLAQSPQVGRLLVAPGNAGTALLAENVPVNATDLDGIVRLVEERAVHLSVVGPEAPLALGLADRLRAREHRVVGPSAAAARLEASKSFAKQIMQRARVPTAAYAVFDDRAAALAHLATGTFPLVVKVDGLAAGKGVALCATPDEARAAVDAFMQDAVHGEAGARVVIEEFLAGPEISLIALVDGERAVAFPPAQDHKRLGDGDTGPNTGGMGAYAPVPWVNDAMRDALVRETIDPVVRTLAEQGTPFRGVLFAGLILTEHGPRVLEYNCRFGDPEAQALLPLLDGDLVPWLDAVADGRLDGALPILPGAALGVVLAAPGYPDAPEPGAAIGGLSRDEPGVLVFHAGTVRDADGTVRVAGGRVLTVVGMGDTLAEAAAHAYAAPITFPGMQFRRDIGRQVLATGPARSTDGPRLAVLASGGGSNLGALLHAHATGVLEAQPAVLVSHQAEAGALRRAGDAGIPALVVSVVDRRDPTERRRMEERLLAILAEFRPDLVVLAGWMLILSPQFVEHCPYPMINVHPALLPTGREDELVPPGFPVLRGAHAVRDALALGLPYTGVTVHYVTPEVDAGPVIGRAVVPIRAGDDEASLYARIKPVEHEILIESIQSVVRTVLSGGVHA